MGNYLFSPFQKNNNNKNNHNENNRNDKIEKSSPSPNKNSLYPKLNDLTNFGENHNHITNNKIISNSHIYYHSHKNKKMKKNKLLFEDTKEGIIMNNDSKNTYSELSSEDWYNATGEYVKPNTQLIYSNDYGGDWIINITE